MGRPIRVLGLLGQNQVGEQGPCLTYRMLNPLKMLGQVGGFETRTVNFGYWTTERDFAGYVQWADVILAHRTAVVMGDAGRMAFAQAGTKLVVDLDDMPSSLEMQNINFSTHAVRAIRAADLVTVSTEEIAKVVRGFNSNVAVLPNAIDEQTYQLPEGWTRQLPGLTVGVQGGKSHGKDWSILPAVFEGVAERHPEVTCVVAGYLPNYLGPKRGYPFHYLPWVEMDQVATSLAEIDIHLAPLRSTGFNSGKSFLKLWDAWMSGKPIVTSHFLYQRVMQDSGGGLLAHSIDEWIDRICYLIEHPAYRTTFAQRGRAYAESHWSTAALARQYAEVYRRLVGDQNNTQLRPVVQWGDLLVRYQDPPATGGAYGGRRPLRLARADQPRPLHEDGRPSREALRQVPRSPD